MQQLPFTMVELASAFDVRFTCVKHGLAAVWLTVTDRLQLLIDGGHGAEHVDFIALYDHSDVESRDWIPVLLDVLKLAIKVQLERYAASLDSLPAQCSTRSFVASETKNTGLQRASNTESTLCSCPLHCSISADMPQCRVRVLCSECVLRSHIRSTLNNAGVSGSGFNMRCKAGHGMADAATCFSMWTGPLRKSPSRATLTRQLLSDMNSLKRRLAAVEADNRRMRSQLDITAQHVDEVDGQVHELQDDVRELQV